MFRLWQFSALMCQAHLSRALASTTCQRVLPKKKGDLQPPTAPYLDSWIQPTAHTYEEVKEKYISSKDDISQRAFMLL